MSRSSEGLENFPYINNTFFPKPGLCSDAQLCPILGHMNCCLWTIVHQTPLSLEVSGKKTGVGCLLEFLLQNLVYMHL